MEDALTCSSSDMGSSSCSKMVNLCSLAGIPLASSSSSSDPFCVSCAETFGLNDDERRFVLDERDR